MLIVTKTNKGRPLGLYKKLLIRIFEAWQSIPPNSNKNYLGFKELSLKICRNFSLSKNEVLDLIRILEEFEYIDVIKTKGIRLNYRVVEK